ncbi:hypothetical protein GYH30_001633 [Glycine max]|nr:hypothetical protein GYH30_001633 [Glycine max]
MVLKAEKEVEVAKAKVSIDGDDGEAEADEGEANVGSGGGLGHVALAGGDDDNKGVEPESSGLQFHWRAEEGLGLGFLGVRVFKGKMGE